MSGGKLGSVFQLGDFVVSAETCTLTKAGQAIKVTPRSMEVLVYLARHHGHVISSQELLDRLWTNITSDHAVHKAIAELRSALDDNASRQSVIKTVPKRGYTLNITPLAAGEAAVNTGASGGRAWVSSLILNPLRQKIVVGAVLAVFAVGGLGRLTGSDPGSAPDVPVLGVLPFRGEMETGDINQFLADGLTNSLLSGLAKLNELHILSLPHDSQYSTINRTAREIGEELRIDQILEGSLMQENDQIRVIVRLTRVADGVQIYSDQFDMTQQNIFSIQDTIVSSIINSLSIHLDERERRDMLDWGTTNALAYRHFMQGEFYNNQFNPADFEQAIAHHQAAIELDPDFENAYLGMATAANNLAVYSRMHRIDELRALVAEIHRHVAARDRNSRILDSIQAIESRMGGVNHLEQEETLREEILSGSPPDYALAHYALFLIGARLFKEAELYLALASEVDPFEISPDEIWSYKADIATPSEEVFIRKRQLQERPNHIGMLGTVGRNLVLEGKLDEARTYIQRQRELDSEGVSAHLTHVVVDALTGELHPHSKLLEAEYAKGPDFNFSNGVLAFMLGDMETGKRFWRNLQPLQKRRLRNLVYAVEKFFPRAVLEDPDYQALLDELGVGKSWQHRLMRGVIAMEPVAGVPLSPEASRALAEDRLMSRNNLWPDEVYERLNLPPDRRDRESAPTPL